MMLRYLIFFCCLVTIIEVLPKEKKQKEEKVTALSQCSVDLFPLFHAAQPLTYTFDLHSILPSDANVDSSSKVRMDKCQCFIDF